MHILIEHKPTQLAYICVHVGTRTLKRK